MTDVRTYISGGHVYCHLRREDLDVSECLGCERLRELNDGSPPYVLCDMTDVPEIATNDPRFIEWWYRHHRRAR